MVQRCEALPAWCATRIFSYGTGKLRTTCSFLNLYLRAHEFFPPLLAAGDQFAAQRTNVDCANVAGGVKFVCRTGWGSSIRAMLKGDADQRMYYYSAGKLKNAGSNRKPTLTCGVKANTICQTDASGKFTNSGCHVASTICSVVAAPTLVQCACKPGFERNTKPASAATCSGIACLDDKFACTRIDECPTSANPCGAASAAALSQGNCSHSATATWRPLPPNQGISASARRTTCWRQTHRSSLSTLLASQLIATLTPTDDATPTSANLLTTVRRILAAANIPHVLMRQLLRVDTYAVARTKTLVSNIRQDISRARARVACRRPARI